MKTGKDFVQGLNIGCGKILYCDFDIKAEIPLEEQIFSLQEDMIQIAFGDRFTLDVGWYPEMNPEGQFSVVAIIDEDWENLLSKINCRTLAELKRAIEKTVKLIDKARKIKDLPYRDVEYEDWD